MAYGIFDLELTEPLPDLGRAHPAGLALILRRKGRVLGFLMKAQTSEPELEPEALSRWIAGEIAMSWVRETLREELGVPGIVNGFPSLTVAVCTRDRPALLRRCLESLYRLEQAQEPGASRWEVLVVDNAPSDVRTALIVEQFSNVRYVIEARPGLDFARNRALREANGELLAYLDDDVVVDRNWLQGLREAWAENPDAAAFTGQVLPLELETEAQILFERRGGFRRGFDKVRYTASTPRGEDGLLYPCRTGIFGVGCNMAFHRRILREIGGFDEALDSGHSLPGGGDHDIFYRIIRAGHPLAYEPGYLVFHQHRRTMAELRRQVWTWGSSVMAFASKARDSDRPLRSRWRKLIFLWFTSHFRELATAIFRRQRPPARLVIWELLGGLVGLCGEYRRSERRVARIRRNHR